MADGKRPQAEFPPEVRREIDSEEADFYIDTKATVERIKEELGRLEASEEKLEGTVEEMKSEGGLEPPTVHEAVVAEEKSIMRLEDRKKKLEQKKEEMRELEEFRGRILKAFGRWTGTDAWMMNIDALAKKKGGEEAGLFTYDDRIEMWEKKGEMTRGLAKIIEPILPGWGKALLVGGEKVVHVNHAVMAEKERKAKRGEKMTSKEANKLSLELIMKEVHLDKLKDVKNIEKSGDLLEQFGGDLGGDLGKKFEFLGGLAKKHPDKISKALAAAVKAVKRKEYEVSDEAARAEAEMDRLEEKEINNFY